MNVQYASQGRGVCFLFLTLGSLSLASFCSAQNYKLSGNMVANGNVQLVRVSPDSARVVYIADQDQDFKEELYSVPLEGGQPPTKLNHPVPGTDVQSFQISHDSSLVVYVANGLYTVPIDGSQAAVQIHPTKPDSIPRISPDDSRVVFRSGVELFSIPMDGSAAAVKLNGPLTTWGQVLVSVRISNDSQWVVYHADQDTFQQEEIYGVPLDGSLPAVKLNGDLVPGGDVQWTFEISPDSSRVVYNADQERDDVFEVYSVPVDGSQPPTKLNGPLAGPDRDVSFLQGISPDSSTVAYRGDEDTLGADDLYVVPLDGSQGAQNLTLALGPGGGGALVSFTSDSSHVLYRAALDASSAWELYSAALDGGQGPTKLNAPLVAGGNVQFTQLAANDRRVVYQADQDTDEIPELFSVPIDGSQAPVKLNGSLDTGGQVSAYVISPNSRWVVYWAGLALFASAIDGCQVASRVHPSLGPGGFVRIETVQISSDSTRVVYAADQETEDVVELYATVLGPFCDLGQGLAGAHGEPVLEGTGALVAGDPVTLALSNALGNTLAHLVIGLARVDVPFKGGVLVPKADQLVLNIPTGPAGEVLLEAPWPGGIPSGFTSYFQYWISDPAGPVGLAASNAVSASAP